ncbi:EF-hand domain-containing protein [Marimonas lutisalis]|uniref:EF-hand domain-containing protein n=1 Tax=Marimonas lutisalis TaxID=2545756 RepID=UPI0010F7E072|nr:EF-hand domain-containing protein [Marimonas lutisalis]
MKRSYIITGLTILSLTAGAGAALAFAKHGERHMRGGHAGGMHMMENFADADADGDGKVTQEEMKAYAKARFDAADTDGNGKLSADEMKAAAEKRAEEARQRRFERMATRMIERMDDDGDCEISFEEMPGQQTGMERMFDRLDADGDGAISEEEMAKMRERMRDGGKGGYGERRHHGHGDGHGYRRGDRD